MANRNVKVIYKKLTKDFERKGYINLNHRLVNTKDELVEIASIFRSPQYETFRIVYMKDNIIVGLESISSKNPTAVTIFTFDKSGRLKAERNFFKVESRMNRLNANGYYMVHNHPSGTARSSRLDLRLTEQFAVNLKGFKGHLIVNSDTYAWIDIDSKGYAYSLDEQLIKGYNKKKIDKLVSKNSIYNVKIGCRSDLIHLMHHIKNSENYSIAILTDARGMPRMILDVPNQFLNMKLEQVKGYFKNLARLNGVDRVSFATNDNKTFKKSLEHVQNGTFLDSICYKEEGRKIYTYKALNKSKDDQKRLFSEDEADFMNVSDTFEEDIPKEKKIRVLYKEVGKKPKIRIIDNTLEAKQKLVKGLIEVIPYNNLLIVCNDEGKIMNLKPNLIFECDYIAGDCFVIGDDYENGDFKSLTMEEIVKIRKDLIHRSFKYDVQKKSRKVDKYPEENSI